ncbi:hypothetical protein Fmac_004578 [Flemingia macrophylla]|uniref:Uncharacterized protein n=1 Tax=Flemingia macrophylla TaxID=520843 RepID=A0ABD1N6S2_9FABA
MYTYNVPWPIPARSLINSKIKLHMAFGSTFHRSKANFSGSNGFLENFSSKDELDWMCIAPSRSNSLKGIIGKVNVDASVVVLDTITVNHENNVLKGHGIANLNDEVITTICSIV